jgi:3-methyladenine DNA glycosylase AlkC
MAKNKPEGVPDKGRVPTVAALRTCIEGRDLDGLIALLEESGRMPTLRQADKSVKHILKDEPQTIYAWGVEMAGRPEWAARLMASWLFSPYYAEHKAEVERLLLHLGDDESWTIREGASWGFARVLEDHFDEVYPLYQEWARHPSENVRRAVVLSVMPVVRDEEHGAQRADACLRLLEPLLADRSLYVRKNLGPFAIGSAILRHFPDLTFATLERWRDQYTDEQVRWNLAMAVSSSGGAAHVKRSLLFLYTLADDERRTVWRAVASAARALGKKQPEAVVPELRRWQVDPSENVRRVAETALSYLE